MAKEFDSLQAALDGAFGPGVEVLRRERASGSDLNEVWRLHLSNGETLFLKTNAFAKWKLFSAEAAGLDAMHATGTVRVPSCLGYGTASGCGFSSRFSFLLMEHLASVPGNPDYWETLARELAAMHSAPTADFVPGGNFGFFEDNVIGTTKQINTPKGTWVEFFRDCRLLPQIEWAKDCFAKEDMDRFDRLLSRLGDYLPEPEYPSLLHGDLWGGNVMPGPDGQAWLIDPAVYVGHREADLAMTELFGGFSRSFYDAYEEATPLQPGYRERRDLYNLYHLLNHLNLFGGGYLGSVLSALRRYT